MRFFISYSRSVNASVGALIDELAKAKHIVWWDGDIPVIGDWWETILKNIETCEVFIFMISEKAVQSDYCLAELHYAATLNIPILPFIIDDYIVDGRPRYSIPNEINDNRFQWLNYDGNVKAMLARISEGCNQINWNYYQRVPQNRPPEPNTGSDSLTKQFQLAVTLAEDGHFAESIKRLRNVSRLEPERLGNLCHQWELKITAYKQIVEYSDHTSTMKLARNEWLTYSTQFKDEEEELFDPFNLAKKLFLKSIVHQPSAPVIDTVENSSTENRSVASPIEPLPEVGIALAKEVATPNKVVRRRKEWQIPINLDSLLISGSEVEFDRVKLLRQAKTIEETLQSFGAPSKVVEVNTGAVITQFGIEPNYLVTRNGKKNRVKVNAITQLDRDLQLALGAKSIRIEAMVAGKGYVGIEIPNDSPSLVNLYDVMISDEFKKLFAKSPLTIALGQRVDGTPVTADLASMPHLLIVGRAGSGKSICMNAIITNLIAKNPPDRLKFLIIDPKRVELTSYNGIPHLIAPVIVELERITGVLMWVTREMDERYKKFSLAGARNIEDFNKHLDVDEQIPYVVVIINELADLMMFSPDETERVITRIAALAHVTGIHLIISTQRPSVDVVTGLIKDYISTRIAFAVASNSDSRIILDQPGAEGLLGKGDMLYISDAPAVPLRLQGVYISEQEIQNIIEYWKLQLLEDVAISSINQLRIDPSIELPLTIEKSTTIDNVNESINTIFDNQESLLYTEAVMMVRLLGKASVSLLQRRLHIGFKQAAKFIDRMEEEGIVGPAREDAKPREVLPKE